MGTRIWSQNENQQRCLHWFYIDTCKVGLIPIFREQSIHYSIHATPIERRQKTPTAIALEETNIHINPSQGGIFWNDVL